MTASWTVTREQLVDALAAIELHPILLPGRDKGAIVAEDMADAILAELPVVTSAIGVSPLTGEPLTVSPEAERAMAEHGLVTVSRADLAAGIALAEHDLTIIGVRTVAERDSLAGIVARLAAAAGMPPAGATIAPERFADAGAGDRTPEALSVDYSPADGAP